MGFFKDLWNKMTKKSTCKCGNKDCKCNTSDSAKCECTDCDCSKDTKTESTSK